MSTPAQALARRVMLNALDKNSPATPAAVTYSTMFDLIRTDPPAAVALLHEAAGIIAATTRMLTDVEGITAREAIDAHT